MPYTATVFRVMIASPSDVPEERDLIRVVLATWNSIHSESRRQVLLPIGWESHSTPDLSGRPQAIINEQVLRDCDLLVGVFWTRIGTPTGAHASGTVEEIEEHIEAGGPVMLYFSNAQVRPASFDHEQYSQLEEFKATCFKRGLVETFEDAADFQAKFTRQLQLRLNREPFSSTQFGGTAIVPALPSIIPTTIQGITPEANQLLAEAAKSGDGIIMYLRFLGGMSLKTHGKEFITDRADRTRAKWEGALRELDREDLISDQSGKGEIFALTDKGYKLAEVAAAKAKPKDANPPESPKQIRPHKGW